MTFNEKIKSDIECFDRVIAQLKANGADAKSIATVEGMKQGAEVFAENNNDNI